jgi:hypothetical protein
MASIDRRIEALERLYGTEPEEDSEEMARRRDEFKAKLLRVREKAAREEAEGNPRRRELLDELEEQMRKRSRARGS